MGEEAEHLVAERDTHCSICNLTSEVRKVDPQLATHNLIPIQVSYCRCSRVCVIKFTKTKALRSTSIGVVDEPKVVDFAHRAEDMHDLFFGEAVWNITYVNVLVYVTDLSLMQSQTYEDDPPSFVVSHDGRCTSERIGL